MTGFELLIVLVLVVALGGIVLESLGEIHRKLDRLIDSNVLPKEKPRATEP